MARCSGCPTTPGLPGQAAHLNGLATCSGRWGNGPLAGQHCGIWPQVAAVRAGRGRFQYLAPSPHRIASHHIESRRKPPSPCYLLRNHGTAHSRTRLIGYHLIADACFAGHWTGSHDHNP